MIELQWTLEEVKATWKSKLVKKNGGQEKVSGICSTYYSPQVEAHFSHLDTGVITVYSRCAHESMYIKEEHKQWLKKMM